MQLDKATAIAERVKAQLAPHCDRIEIAGSIRRRKADVGDIEIVAIPKPYDVGLFASGIAPLVSAWPKVRGELPCKYTQRTLPDGIALDLFFATAENWGLIYAIRTGSADYSHRVLACGWVRNGYKSADGMLSRDGVAVPVREERDLFRLAGVPWVEPEARRGRGWMKYDLTFTNASDQRGMLAVHGPRCVAEWHAAKVLRQRVAHETDGGTENQP